MFVVALGAWVAVGVIAATTAACWLVATAWIPLLVAAEVRRARAGWPGFEIARWATVFPLGMYAVACAGLATIAPNARTALHDVSSAVFWIALAGWSATAFAMLAHVRRSAHRTGGRGPHTSP